MWLLCQACQITNEGNITFRIADYNSGAVTSLDLLTALDVANTKIVYLVRGQRDAPLLY